MKKTLKNYCLNASQYKKKQLKEIAKRYSLVKNDVFHRFGSIEGLQYLDYPRAIRDEWVKTKYPQKFGLQARMWKMALEEAFANIKSKWSNAINKVRSSIFKTQSLTPDEKFYAYYLLHSYDLLYKAITFTQFSIPSKF